jgi:hypothetical protein
MPRRTSALCARPPTPPRTSGRQLLLEIFFCRGSVLVVRMVGVEGKQEEEGESLRVCSSPGALRE